VLYVVPGRSAKPRIERPHDYGRCFTHYSHGATVVSQLTVTERTVTRATAVPVWPLLLKTLAEYPFGHCIRLTTLFFWPVLGRALAGIDFLGSVRICSVRRTPGELKQPRSFANEDDPYSTRAIGGSSRVGCQQSPLNVNATNNPLPVSVTNDIAQYPRTPVTICILFGCPASPPDYTVPSDRLLGGIDIFQPNKQFSEYPAENIQRHMP